MVTELGVEHSVSELMHIFELSLKSCTFESSKDTLWFLPCLPGLRLFGTNGNNRDFHVRLKCLLPWTRAHTFRDKYDSFYFCPIPDSTGSAKVPLRQICFK